MGLLGTSRPKRAQSPTTIKRIIFIVTAVVVVVIAGSAFLYWKLKNLESASGLENASNERIWEGVSCRVRLYLQRAEGEFRRPFMDRALGDDAPRKRVSVRCRGSAWRRKSNLARAPVKTTAKRARASFANSARCATAFDGSGGPVGPSLTRSDYSHGDSDFAIYQDAAGRHSWNAYAARRSTDHSRSCRSPRI